MKKAMINYIQNPKNDELYTPEYAIKPLIKYLELYRIQNDVKRKPIIWECTDYGSSNITKVLRENGYEVVSTHKNDFNFLTDAPEFDFDMIVTNPPYSLKDEFLEKCYEYGKPFCMLLPITALEGVERGKLYRKYGIGLLVLDRRCNFMNDVGKKSNWFNTSWFCYKVLPRDLIFEQLEKSE